ncbi:MAG: HNH endonuclease [Gammaproteobacteria bacterium]|nr:HNH endonuclease [Gammaproteobacteria bacterium]
MSRAHHAMPNGRWQSLRRAVFMRDRWLCQKCLTPGRKLECDHIVPLAAGGDHSMANLQTLCRDCHIAKSQEERGNAVPRGREWDRYMAAGRYERNRP